MPLGELTCPVCGELRPATQMNGMLVVECPKDGVQEAAEDFDRHHTKGPLGERTQPDAVRRFREDMLPRGF